MMRGSDIGKRFFVLCEIEVYHEWTNPIGWLE